MSNNQYSLNKTKVEQTESQTDSKDNERISND